MQPHAGDATVPWPKTNRTERPTPAEAEALATLAANVEALRAELAAVRARLAGKTRPGRRDPQAGPLDLETKADDGRERAS